MNFRKVSLLIVILLAASFLVSCQKAEEASKPVKIATSVWPGSAHAFIAKEKGFFQKNGVEVELVLKTEYSEEQELYKNGETDGIFEVYADTIFHNVEGLKTKVVYVVDYSDNGDIIIGKPEFNSLADLKGKKIGVEGINSFSHLFVLTALEKAGLKESEIQIENIPAQQVLKALEEGRIDAGHTWEPTKSAALEKGYKQLGKAGDIPGIITDVLAFNNKIIKERPDDIQAIVKSMLEARDFVYSNREEALEIMAAAEEMSKEGMDEGINGVHQPNLNENKEAMKESEATTSLYGSGKIIADFYINRGQLSVIPDFGSMIEPKFVNGIGQG